MYILKVKGTYKIPDYIQIRDNQFTLISYFTLHQAEKALNDTHFNLCKEKVISMLPTLSYGKIHKLDC